MLAIRQQWFCEICRDEDGNLEVGVANKLSSIQALLHIVVKRLEKFELDCSDENIDKKIEAAVDKKMAERFKEKEDKEKRKLNIIISNITESNSTSTEDRKNDDLESVKKVITEIAPGAETQVEAPLRLGAFKVGQNVRPRGLRDTVKSEAAKDEIMKNAYKINMGGDQSIHENLDKP